MKKLISLASFCLFFTSYYSQKFQVSPNASIGLGHRIYTDNLNMGLKKSRAKSDGFGLGASVGFAAQYYVNDTWSVELGVARTIRSYNISSAKFPIGAYLNSINPSPTFLPNSRFDYVEIPLTVFYNKIGEKFNFHVGLGLIGQKLIKYDISDQYYQSRPQFNVSPSLVLGTSFNLDDQSQLRLSLVNSVQLINNSDHVPRKENNIKLLGFDLKVGYYYSF